MTNHWKHLNRLLMVLFLLVLMSTPLGVLAGIAAQPAQVSLRASRTTRPTRTPTARPTRTPTSAPTSTPTATPTSAGTPTPTPMPGPNGVWSLASSPNTGSPNNYFFGVSAIATNDVWAVGAYGTLGITDWQVIEHWNGTNWSLAASPTLTTPNELLAVSAIATNDVWAVGGYDSGGQSLIEHWDGSNWNVATNPNPGTLNRFLGVAAISSSNVWAVGYVETNAGLLQTLAEHWDGTSWSVIPSPNVPNVSDQQLNAVTAVPGSPNELWAVGTAGTATLILHWNGVQWSIVSSPNVGTNPDLASVAAISTNDVWAVGHTGGSSGPLTLIVHWNGSKWSVVPSPNPSSTQNRLLGVAALATNNVWAVGSFINTAVGNLQTLLLQWNGAAWVQVPGDNSGPSGLGFELAAVSATAASDIWSVGDDSHTLAEHWNGASWSIVATPNGGTGRNVINGVSGASSTDVWEAGYYTFGTEERTLIEHWDGASWSIVPSPNSGKRANVLNGVIAISPSNVWAVGSADSGVALDQVTLILHWDGTSWGVVPSPSPGTEGLNSLLGVAANSANDVWAVGSFTNIGSYAQTLIERWNGSTWSVIPGANVLGTNNGLYGVAALGAGNVWAVGYSGSGVFSPLVEQWNGSSWSIVASPDPQTSSNVLRAVSATGASDIWAVGIATNLYTNAYGPLIEHWNGNGWSVAAGGCCSFFLNRYLLGIAAVTTGDAWAVGTTDGVTYIERWNGSSWNDFGSPNVTGGLNATTAITACDVWAAGQTYVTNIGSQTLNEHFACN